ncbi:MAG: RIP metalloprotease RseP [Deltaproteobacteria bacterium]|nr:RIP metalloprotease RseP [Deltaproteobacteria bacterium]
MTIIYFVVALGLLVFVHEFGHFLVAKLSGIRVEKFSLGFGPKLIGFRRGETDYRLSLLPLGGYVKLSGEDPDSPEADQPNSYSHKSIFQRLGVVVAGPFMNLLLAFVFMAVVFFIGKMEPAYLDQKPVVLGVAHDSPAASAGLEKGDEILQINGQSYTTWRNLIDQILLHPGDSFDLVIRRGDQLLEKKVALSTHQATGSGFLGIEPGLFIGNDPVVDEVVPEGPAAQAGLVQGDRVISVSGAPIETWTEMSEKISASEGKPIALSLKRGEMVQEKVVSAQYDKEGKRWFIGIRKDSEKTGAPQVLKKYPLGQAIKMGALENLKLTDITFGVLGRLVTFQLSYKALGGPIRIAQGAAMAAESGISYFLYFVAFLSLQLGILNILPIPVLDGGHVVYLLAEKIIRRPVSMRVRAIADQTGMVLLILLMVLVTFNDINSVWGVSHLFEKMKSIF